MLAKRGPIGWSNFLKPISKKGMCDVTLLWSQNSWISTIFLDQRRPFALSNDGRKGTGYRFVPESNHEQRSHACQFLSFFCHICSTTDSWDPEILLPWYFDVATSPLCCVNSCPPEPLVSFDHVTNKTSSPSFHYLYCNTVYISNQWCFFVSFAG